MASKRRKTILPRIRRTDVTEARRVVASAFPYGDELLHPKYRRSRNDGAATWVFDLIDKIAYALAARSGYAQKAKTRQLRVRVKGAGGGGGS